MPFCERSASPRPPDPRARSPLLHLRNTRDACTSQLQQWERIPAERQKGPVASFLFLTHHASHLCYKSGGSGRRRKPRSSLYHLLFVWAGPTGSRVLPLGVWRKGTGLWLQPNVDPAPKGGLLAAVAVSPESLCPPTPLTVHLQACPASVTDGSSTPALRLCAVPG